MLAYDEATGTTGSFPVTAVLAHDDPVLVHLTIADAAITTTPEHPFFVQGHGWVAAARLWLGAPVRTAAGGVGRVQALALEPRTARMYNLTVATAHTFFVGAGGWLVHNSCNTFSKFLDNGAGIMAEVDKQGTLWTAVEVPSSLKGQGIGSGLFADAWSALGDQVSSIGGKWNKSMPDNLNSFNRNVGAGMPLADAALNTFTGKQAAARGFHRVSFLRRDRNVFGKYTNIEVLFE